MLLNIRLLNPDDLVAEAKGVSLFLSVTAGGNRVEEVDIVVDVASTERVDYDGEGNPVVVIDELRPGQIVITASKEGFEDGVLEIDVPETPGTPEPDEPPEPTPAEPELPVGENAAVVMFAEALRMGFTYKTLDREALNQITSGLSALEAFVMGEVDEAAKAAAQEIIDLVSPQIHYLEEKVQATEHMAAEVEAARTDARSAKDEVSRLVPVVEAAKDKADVAFVKATAAENAVGDISARDEQQLNSAVEEAVKSAMGKKKLLFL